MANKAYRLANQALQDLNDIADYIATDNPSASDRVLDTLLASFELLGEIASRAILPSAFSEHDNHRDCCVS